MMAFNWKLVVVLIAICLGLVSIVDYATAEESNVTIIEDPVSTPYFIPMIQQGDTVYVGDYVDVSGFCGGYVELAYWDGYDMYDEPPMYNVTFANGKKAYTNFYVDPDIFDGKYGRWFKYNRVYESRGNNLAFIVAPKSYRNASTTYQNGTVTYANQTQEYEYPKMSIEERLLPEKKVNDYLISSEEYFNLTTSGKSALWLFNPDDNSIIYTTNNAGELVISAHNIQSLDPRNYKILIQNANPNATEFDVIYNKVGHEIKWFDRAGFAVRTINTDNMVPDVTIEKLEQTFPKTRDSYTIKTLVVRNPEITINSMQEMYIGAAKDILHDYDVRGNVSVMEVKGYTNVRPGVNISITLDEKTTDPRSIRKITYYTTSVGDNLGEWRQYRVYVPLYWDSLEPGMHTLIARTELGGFVNADFPVNEMPSDSFIPSQTVRWAGDENPWKANLTHEIVTVVETKEIVKEVIKEVGPTDEQVYAQQKKIEDERWEGYKNMAIAGVGLLACCIGGFFLIRYLVGVWRRVRKE